MARSLFANRLGGYSASVFIFIYNVCVLNRLLLHYVVCRVIRRQSLIPLLIVQGRHDAVLNAEKLPQNANPLAC